MRKESHCDAAISSPLPVTVAWPLNPHGGVSGSADRRLEAKLSRRLALKRSLKFGTGAILTGGLLLRGQVQASPRYLADGDLNLTLHLDDQTVEYYLECAIGFTSDERVRADEYGARFVLGAEMWEQDNGRGDWLDGDDGVLRLDGLYFGNDDYVANDYPLPSMDDKEMYWWHGSAARGYFDHDSTTEDEVYALFTLWDLERDEVLETFQTANVSNRF